MKAPLTSLLTICGLEELGHHSSRGVTHVLSILDPEWPEPDAFSAFDLHHRTTLKFHDVILPGPGLVLPDVEHVEAILKFGHGMADEVWCTEIPICSFTVIWGSRAQRRPWRY